VGRKLAVPIEALGALAAVALIAALLPVAAPAHSGLQHRSCAVSPELKTLGVKCEPAKRIAERALAKSDCPPGLQSCRQTVQVQAWTCKGWFPGEGWTFTCSAGERRIHYSGGG
jgi:hypothetical protein